MKKTRIIIVMLLVLTGAVSVFSAAPRRRMTPVNNSATMTQSVNETADDTARINAKRRASSISYVNEDGRTIYVDTITGQEWTDSTTLGRVPKMDYPLLHAVHVGLNLWDPLMRAFGQHYGIADVWAELSLHNRYLPVFESRLLRGGRPALRFLAVLVQRARHHAQRQLLGRVVDIQHPVDPCHGRMA